MYIIMNFNFQFVYFVIIDEYYIMLNFSLRSNIVGIVYRKP